VRRQPRRQKIHLARTYPLATTPTVERDYGAIKFYRARGANRRGTKLFGFSIDLLPTHTVY